MSPGKLLAKNLSHFEQSFLVTKLQVTINELVSPEKILLFGSAARNEMTDASDLDVIVIVKEPQEIKAVQSSLNQLSRLMDWPVDCLVIDQARFDRKVALGGVYQIAKEEGIILK
ncbi:MAG: nucleotidyltransferase domain-containing protein [Proteobacteria bacterium]|nr:nucleotidyltransferase domain-containing protein [Pseudomonadota bacterium]